MVSKVTGASQCPGAPQTRLMDLGTEQLFLHSGVEPASATVAHFIEQRLASDWRILLVG